MKKKKKVNPAHTLRKPCTNPDHEQIMSQTDYFVCMLMFLPSNIQYPVYWPFPRPNWTLQCPVRSPQIHQSISYPAPEFPTPWVFFSRSWVPGSNFDWVLLQQPPLWSSMIRMIITCPDIWKKQCIYEYYQLNLIKNLYFTLNHAFWGSLIHTWCQRDPYMYGQKQTETENLSISWNTSAMIIGIPNKIQPDILGNRKIQ